MACLLFMDIVDTILCTADVFIWMEWRVVVISFPDSTFDVVESIVNPMPSRFYLTLFSRSCIVLYSISCAVIHFELVVWKVWGICLDSFILCAVLYSFQGHLLKRLCSLSVFSWLVLHGLLLNFLFWSTDWIVYPFTGTMWCWLLNVSIV